MRNIFLELETVPVGVMEYTRRNCTNWSNGKYTYVEYKQQPVNTKLCQVTAVTVTQTSHLMSENAGTESFEFKLTLITQAADKY